MKLSKARKVCCVLHITKKLDFSTIAKNNRKIDAYAKYLNGMSLFYIMYLNLNMKYYISLLKYNSGNKLTIVGSVVNNDSGI